MNVAIKSQNDINYAYFQLLLLLLLLLPMLPFTIVSGCEIAESKIAENRILVRMKWDSSVPTRIQQWKMERKRTTKKYNNHPSMPNNHIPSRLLDSKNS